MENILNDFNEPPSEMALLHPELSQHPWALEQVSFCRYQNFLTLSLKLKSVKFASV